MLDQPENVEDVRATLADAGQLGATTGYPRMIDLVRSAVAELRPRLQRDGGDIELVGIDGDIVVVDLKGTCVGCVLSSVTLAGVRKRLIDLTGRPLRVVPASAMPMGWKGKAAQ
jgi:Fe-S cluster biogenesis protein NfuA